MRTITKEVYTFEELSDEAKEKARDWYREILSGDSYYQDEVVDSLKGLFEAANIKLENWSIGAYNRGGNYVRFDIDNASELKGKRAFAWLENNLLSKPRITRSEYLKKRKDYFGYGSAYRVGKIKPCPFTGICYDDDLLDGLIDAIKSGDNLKDAFKSLADLAASIIENQYEYLSEDDQVDEAIIANGYEFDISGSRAR